MSGKNAEKVDRGASYAARNVAQHVGATAFEKACELQLKLAIGVALPVSVFINTYGTAKIDEAHIEELVKKHFDLRPAAIIERFDMRRPIYSPLASYGHFGRPELDLPWEKLDYVDVLRKDA